MRWTLGFSACLLLVAAAVLVQQSVARNEPSRAITSSPKKFVVHEWGTFTSFSGSDGVKLEFRPLVENDLPAFVLHRATQAGLTNPLGKVNMSVLQRMETPVTYFYTDEPRQVNVRVGFPEGLLTEFYPPVDSMQPAYKGKDSESMTNSELDWGSVWLIPEKQFQVDLPDSKLASLLESHLRKRILPTIDGYNHYAYARETDSAIVYKKPAFEKDSPLYSSGGFLEKFLFYRGVGNFSLPLELKAQPDGKYQLSNLGQEPMQTLFLVTVKGDQLWFKQYPQIMPGGNLTLEQSQMAANESDLASAVEAALIATGLYPKEAAAMVNTWRSSWFGEDGTRLFYLLPQSMTDKLLPLEVKPAPDEVLRVMVGRLEIMRPEDEQRVTDIVRESARLRAVVASYETELPAGAPSTPKRLPKALLSLGRLAEPALVRIKNIATDETLRMEAALLLDELQVLR